MAELVATAMANAGVIGAGSIATATTIINAAVIASSVAYSQNQQRRARRSAADMASRGREFSLKTTDSPRSLLVGRASVPIERIVYLDTFGERRERVIFVAAFGAHEIDAIEDIHFDGESIGALDADGWVTSGKYANPRHRQSSVGATWPSPGQLVTYLPQSEHLTTYEVVSVAVENNSDNAQDTLPSGANGWVFADWPDPQSPTGSRRAVIAGNGSSRYTGQNVIITIRTEERRPLVRAVKFLGAAAGHVDSELISISAGTDTPWTSQHRGNNVPRVRFELVWDADVFGPTGFPDIRFIVRGAKVPSFTGGGSSWTQNAARITAWFLTRPEGFNAQPADIDTTLAAAAQNACDESVPYGDGSQSQPRYQCDGVIDTEANPVETLRDLLGSMIGRAVPVGGKWDLYAGVGQTPTYTLTDDDLAGGDELVVPTTAFAEMVNCVRGRFVTKEGDQYIVNDAPPYESPTYLAEDDGRKRWLEVSLPFTTDVHAAQRIQRIQLHRARNALIWSSKYAFGAHAARAGMTVRAQHREYGWDALESGAGKRFEIEEHAKAMDGTVDLIMRETSPAIYDWSYNEAVDPDPTPNTAFPDPTYVEPLELVSIVSNSETFDVGTDGQKIPYAMLTWKALPPDVAAEATRIEIEWKGAGERSYKQERLTPEQTSVKLRPVVGGMLISGSAVVVNGLGVSSSPAFFTHLVSTELPSTAQGTAGGNLLTNAGFDWGVEGYNRFGGGPNDTFQRWGVSNTITVRPSVAMLDQRPGSTGSIGVNTPLFDCEPGKRYLVMARMHSFRSRAWVALAFANADHQHVAQTNSPYTTAQTSEPGSLDAFEFRHAFVTAPPTARKMLFQFGKLQTEAPWNSSWARIYQPMVCEVVGGDFIPIWSYGPIERVAPGQMPPGSSTIIARATPLGTIDVPLNGGFPLAVASLSIPPFPVAHRLRISARWVGTRTGVTNGEFVQIQAIGNPGGASLRIVDLLPRSTVDPYTEERTTQVIVSRAANTAAWEVSLRPRFIGAGSVTMTGVEFTVEFIAN